MEKRLKYPILLVHGMGFRDSKKINYWGRIPKALEQIGCRIFYGHQDSNASIETNAHTIADRIHEIVQETGSEKVNIIAHSKGGLDCRYAISLCTSEIKWHPLQRSTLPTTGPKRWIS